MIARRMGQHTPLAFFVREAEQGMARAPVFKCADFLQVFSFKKQLGPGQGIDQTALKNSGPMNIGLDQPMGRK